MPSGCHSRKRPWRRSSVVFAAAAFMTWSDSTTTTFFQVEGSSSSSTEPTTTLCGPSLTCQNGGVCRQGNSTWLHRHSGSGTNNNNAIPTETTTHGDQTNVEGYYCDCPHPPPTSSEEEETTPLISSSYTGLSCEIPYRECHYQSGYAICYYGGSCLAQDPTSWEDDSPVCDCSKAQHNGVTYQGRNCEQPSHPKRSPCQRRSDEEPACLNNGICNDDPDPVTGSYCTCPAGFSGYRCETSPDAAASLTECTLQCHHDGICHVRSSLQQPPPQDEDDEEEAPQWGSFRGMYCSCPAGYAGVQCEHIAQHCGDELVCLHGSTCVVNQAETEYECQCAPSEYYIGGMCLPNTQQQPEDNDGQESPQPQEQFRVTHCQPSSAAEFGLGMAIPAFCVNGGTCTEAIVDGYLVPFCDCPSAFTGPHCEYVRSAADGDSNTGSNNNNNSQSNNNGKGRPSSNSFLRNHVAANIVLLTLCGLGLLWILRQGYRKYQIRKRQKEQVVLNLQSFREENPGAVSANGSMLFPSATMHRGGGGAAAAAEHQFTMAELMHDVEIT